MPPETPHHIEVRLDHLKPPDMSWAELARRIDLTEANLHKLRRSALAIRFTTLSRLCEVFECQPGDLLVYVPDSAAIDAPLTIP